MPARTIASTPADADLRKREDAYLLGGRMASRFNIDAKHDCTAVPPAEGESAVGGLFIKQSCEVDDPAQRRKIALRVNFFRKPGQSAFNPQMATPADAGPVRELGAAGGDGYRSPVGWAKLPGMAVRTCAAPRNFAHADCTAETRGQRAGAPCHTLRSRHGRVTHPTNNASYGCFVPSGITVSRKIAWSRCAS